MSGDADLSERYRNILREYLKEGGEIFLSQGYDLARQALVEGHGVLDIADIHHRALQQLCVESPRDVGLMWAAGDFFAECLSPFEMSHRGAQEGTRALRHLNQFLEGELKRIAHALHDEAGQLLASVHIELADIASELPPPTRLRFEKVERLLTQIEVELRNMSHDLRPTVLDNLGLVPALEFLAERVAKRNGLNVSVIGGAGERLPTTVETALYRIVQEALNNAVKHAKASSIKIELQRTPLKVACRVRDDGLGFDVHRQSGDHGLGLLGIRERLNVLGGSLHLTAEPRHGTTLLAEIPLGD
jgi:signal transduction histidine kinase